MLILQIKLL